MHCVVPGIFLAKVLLSLDLVVLENLVGTTILIGKSTENAVPFLALSSCILSQAQAAFVAAQLTLRKLPCLQTSPRVSVLMIQAGTDKCI